MSLLNLVRSKPLAWLVLAAFWIAAVPADAQRTTTTYRPYTAPSGLEHLGPLPGATIQPPDVATILNQPVVGTTLDQPGTTMQTPSAQPGTATVPIAPPVKRDVNPMAARSLLNDTLSTSFRKGLADRNSWENWVSTLSGNYLDGVKFWAEQRSLAHPPSCYRNGQEFTAGCLAAEQRLEESDVQRKADPEYKLGWNNY